MRFQDELRELARATGLDARSIAAEADSESMSWQDAAYLIASRVQAGNLQAMRLAEAVLMLLELEADVSAGVVTGAASIPEVERWTDHDRLELAATTILTDRNPETILSRVERLGRAEVVGTGQGAYHDGMQTSEGVEGWRRDLEGGACQLCTWWSRDGRVWPKDHPMQKHTGCECTQEAVIAASVQKTMAQKAAERRQAAIENTDRRSAEVRAIQAAQR